MLRLTPPLKADRRRAVALAQTVRVSAREAEEQRKQALLQLHSRITTPSALLLAFVAGLTTAAVAPRGRTRRSSTQRDSGSTHPALRLGLGLLRTYALPHLATLVAASLNKNRDVGEDSGAP